MLVHAQRGRLRSAPSQFTIATSLLLNVTAVLGVAVGDCAAVRFVMYTTSPFGRMSASVGAIGPPKLVAGASRENTASRDVTTNPGDSVTCAAISGAGPFPAK